MAHHDRYTSLILGALGLYIAFEGWRLQIGTLSQPKAGLMIFAAGLFLSTLSAVLFVFALRTAKREKKKAIWKDVQWRKGVKVMIALATYAAVFRWMGFLSSTLLLLLFLLKGIEPQRWGRAIVLSGLTSVICYLIFVVFLEVQFPAGVWVRMLP
jgi:hypothetical protein